MTLIAVRPPCSQQENRIQIFGDFLKMKKTLIALAAATLASTSALAAQVTISGIVDAGFAYNNVNRMNEGTTEDFTLDSGNHNGSRFIFKGTEDLGDGYAVSFYLENGFSLDDGTQGQGGRLFGREARLSFETPYGTMSFGRMGALTAGMGTYDIFQFYGDTFDGGWNYAVDLSNWFGRDRYDNMLTLVTPKVAGFTGYFQYSFGTDTLNEQDDATPGERDKDRYAALGLSYENGPLRTVLVLDTILRQQWKDGEKVNQNLDDAQAVSLGIGYDFDFMTLTFGAQYGKNETQSFFLSDGAGSIKTYDTTTGARSNTNGTADGYTLGLGASFPLPCGTFRAAAYYGDVEVNDSMGEKYKNVNVVLGHEYPFSKRTFSYIGLAYKHAWAKADGEKFDEERTFTGMLGLVHKF